MSIYFKALNLVFVVLLNAISEMQKSKFRKSILVMCPLPRWRPQQPWAVKPTSLHQHVSQVSFSRARQSRGLDLLYLQVRLQWRTRSRNQARLCNGSLRACCGTGAKRVRLIVAVCSGWSLQVAMWPALLLALQATLQEPRGIGGLYIWTRRPRQINDWACKT